LSLRCLRLLFFTSARGLQTVDAMFADFKQSLRVTGRRFV